MNRSGEKKDGGFSPKDFVFLQIPLEFKWEDFIVSLI